MTNAAVKKLCDILALERDAALGGELNVLIELAKKKERAITKLPSSNLTQIELQEVINKIEYNQRLMQSVIAGVTSATHHIARNKSELKNTGVYTKDGTRTTFSVGAGTSSEKY